MERPKIHRKKQFVPNAFKYMIAVSSIAGTLGIWNLLANKDLINVNAQNNANTQDPTSSIDQAPLPTLVPVMEVDLSSIRSSDSGAASLQPAQTKPLREVDRPTSPPGLNNPSAISNNGQAAPAILPPAPVTSTQSSRP